MFSQLHQRTRRLDGARLVAVIIHCLLLYFLVRPLKPIFVTPSSLAFGNNGKTAMTTLVYFHQQGFADAERHLDAPKPPKRPRPKPEQARKPPLDAAPQADRAGSPYGTLLSGPLNGHDVRPALPVVFPDPVVSRSELPDGVAGTVIVEITIDEIGNVVATKVLQPLGYGIEERVVAVLRNWHFRPATMDGRPIPSQQDVYFRFPS